MPKGEKFGFCANPCCNTVGAASPDIGHFPMEYYCQDCAKLMNEKALNGDEKPPCIVRPNQFR